MRTTLQFHFGDLPQKIRDSIRVQNEGKEYYSSIHFDGQYLGKPQQRVTSTRGLPLSDELLLEVELSDTADKIPDWLKSVKCTLECYETFYGYIENGLFRYGNVRAEVNTFPRDISKTEYDSHSDMDWELYRYEILATKLTITGEGYGATVYNGAIKLYRMIRAGKVNEQCTIEQWPVRVPPGLVTIGASTGEVVKNC